MRHEVFDDFDAFAESIDDVDSRMILVNPKRQIWTSSGVNLGGIDVQFGVLGSGNLAQAELRQDGYFLYLPLTAGIEYVANGSVFSDISFAVIEPGCEFCISTKDPHDWCAMFVPTEMLTRHVAEDSPLSKPKCRITRPIPQAAHRFRSIVRQVINVGAECPEFESSAAAKKAAMEVLKVAVSALGQRETELASSIGRPKLNRQRIIECCMDFLDQQSVEAVESVENVTVSNLATAADVSQRTLRRAFNQYFGFGPIRYLQLRQLQEVRRALLDADADATTVSSVLIENGVWEFSRFAARYRQQFDELPSETLRTKKRRSFSKQDYELPNAPTQTTKSTAT